MEILSFAKINLFLRITGRRPDGYHTLFSLMTRLDLADTITLVPAGGGIKVFCKHPAVPEDETNLAYRAAARFYDQAGMEPDVAITIDKQIPVAAGLGGGSSNAAAVLAGLNRCYEFPLSGSALMELAAAIGADVPFFLLDTPALAEGIGERLTPYHRLPPLPVVLAVPDIHVSTAEVYKSVNLALTFDKNFSNLNSFTESTCFDAETHLVNDLETVTAAWYVQIKRLRQMLEAEGAIGSLMSGSGPSVFGIFPDAGSAGRAGRSLKGRTVENTAVRVYVTNILTGDTLRRNSRTFPE